MILSIGLAMTANAAVIGTYTHDYGKSSGLIAPSEYGKHKGRHVEVGSAGSGRSDFRDIIDISGIGPNVTVDSIDLMLMFDEAGPDPKKSENWFVEISGAGSGIGTNTVAMLDEDQAPQTFTLRPGTDAFEAAVAGLRIDFTFTEPGIGRSDAFRLFSATVRVNGSVVAAVPLPAPGVLLLAALGALAFLRRRSAAATNRKLPQT
ncbi:hypothetical protein [Jannaschia faecimaris]|nr:hypothetical protein [Jannaschia faecimaris]